jgi:MFS family permease
VLANLLALAAVCPFVGALSDLVGRRYVAMAGAMFIIIGMIVCSTAHTMNNFIGSSPYLSSPSTVLPNTVQLVWLWQALGLVSMN